MVVLWVGVVSYERVVCVCEVTLYGPGFRVQVNLVVNDELVAVGRVLSQQRLERRDILTSTLNPTGVPHSQKNAPP